MYSYIKPIKGNIETQGQILTNIVYWGQIRVDKLNLGKIIILLNFSLGQLFM